MKINLGINIVPIEGFTNLDPCGGANKTPVDPSNLDFVCEPAACTFFLADDILDYIHGSKLIETIKNWTSKLRHGATIVVGGTDVGMLSKLIYSGKISVVDANKILFGQGDNPWAIKQGCYSCYDISSILEEEGLNVTKKRLSGMRYIVEANRV